MIAELDPYVGAPSRRAALAGLGQLSVLDWAERLTALVRDEGRSAAERAQALASLPRANSALGLATATSMISDSAGAVRRAAQNVLQEYGLNLGMGPSVV
ncbi:MAG: hypothetical protein JWM76_1858 [Pseudonocardiales bacterium]|nr:hypothetical protein [Pseudonocardiales bacterium]